MRIKPLHLNVDLVNRTSMVAAANRAVEQERIQDGKAPSGKPTAGGGSTSQSTTANTKKPKQEPRKEPAVWRFGGKDEATLWVIYVRAEGSDMVFYANSVVRPDVWVELERLSQKVGGVILDGSRDQFVIPAVYTPDYWTNFPHTYSYASLPTGTALDFQPTLMALGMSPMPDQTSASRLTYHVRRGYGNIYPVHMTDHTKMLGHVETESVTRIYRDKTDSEGNPIEPERVVMEDVHTPNTGRRAYKTEHSIKFGYGGGQFYAASVEMRYGDDVDLTINSTLDIDWWVRYVTDRSWYSTNYRYEGSYYYIRTNEQTFSLDTTDIKPWTLCPGYTRYYKTFPYQGQPVWQLRDIGLNIGWNPPAKDGERGCFFIQPKTLDLVNEDVIPLRPVTPLLNGETRDCELIQPPRSGYPHEPQMTGSSGRLRLANRDFSFKVGKNLYDYEGEKNLAWTFWYWDDDGWFLPDFADISILKIGSSIGVSQELFPQIGRECRIYIDRSNHVFSDLSDFNLANLERIFSGEDYIEYMMGHPDWDWSTGEYMPLMVAYM